MNEDENPNWEAEINSLSIHRSNADPYMYKFSSPNGLVNLTWGQIASIDNLLKHYKPNANT
jgi:hypothetical protein